MAQVAVCSAINTQHKYSVGRAYSCWMLNWWSITYPVGFKRLISIRGRSLYIITDFYSVQKSKENLLIVKICVKFYAEKRETTIFIFVQTHTHTHTHTHTYVYVYIIFVCTKIKIVVSHFLHNSIYEGRSEINASYFIMLAHDVRGEYCWYGSRGWTFPPIFR